MSMTSDLALIALIDELGRHCGVTISEQNRDRISEVWASEMIPTLEIWPNEKEIKLVRSSGDKFEWGKFVNIHSFCHDSEENKKLNQSINAGILHYFWALNYD